jgi:hypothetical protein
MADDTPPPSIAQLMGEDLGPDPFADVAAEPPPRSSAAKIGQYQRARDHDARRYRALSHLAAIAAEQEEDEALARVTSQLRRRRTPSDADLALADRARARRDGAGVPSADLLADRSTVPETDDRPGRRPRS